MECRDRYFIVAVNLSLTGGAPQFEAVGKILRQNHDFFFFFYYYYLHLIVKMQMVEDLNLPPDETGVYPLTTAYAALHGYSVDVFPARGLAELRASYFSCHTYNKVAT